MLRNWLLFNGTPAPPGEDLTEDDGVTLLYEDDGVTVLTED